MYGEDEMMGVIDQFKRKSHRLKKKDTILMVSLDELEMNRKDKKIDDLKKKAAFRATARANREKKLMTTIETRDRKIKKLGDELTELKKSSVASYAAYSSDLKKYEAALENSRAEIGAKEATITELRSQIRESKVVKRERDALEIFFCMLKGDHEYYLFWFKGILAQAGDNVETFDEIMKPMIDRWRQEYDIKLPKPPVEQ